MLRQSILTKILPATAYRGMRVKAVTSNGADTVTLQWDYAIDNVENHMAAAAALANKLRWSGRWLASTLGAANDYEFCFHLYSEDCPAFEVAP